jgi:hypothetical protein
VTVEDMITLEMADIVAVQVVCKCGRALSSPPGHVDLKPYKCPGCGEDTIKERSEEREYLQALAKALGGFTQIGANKHTFRVRLQVHRPPFLVAKD